MKTVSVMSFWVVTFFSQSCDSVQNRDSGPIRGLNENDPAISGKISRITEQSRSKISVLEYLASGFRVFDNSNTSTVFGFVRAPASSLRPDISVSPESKFLTLVDSNDRPFGERRRAKAANALEVWDLSEKKKIYSILTKELEEIGDDYFDTNTKWLDERHFLVQWNWRREADCGPSAIRFGLFDLERRSFTSTSESLSVGEVSSLSPDHKLAVCQNRYGVLVNFDGGISIGGLGITNVVSVLDVKSLSVIGKVRSQDLIGKGSSFFDALWIDSGASFAVVGSDHNVYKVPVDKSRKPTKLVSHQDTIVQILVNLDSNVMTTCSADRTVKFFDLDRCRHFKTISDLPSGAACALAEKDCTFIGTFRGDLFLHSNEKIRSIYKGDGHPIRNIRRIKGTEFLAITRALGAFGVFDCRTEKMVVESSEKELRLIGATLVDLRTGKLSLVSGKKSE